jgi:sugar/nucleoside kinase (ribokinase family)
MCCAPGLTRGLRDQQNNPRPGPLAPARPWQAVGVLRDQGVREVLVTLGKGGSMMFAKGVSRAEDAVRMDSFNVDNVIDTTGAGDCFRAACVFVARCVWGVGGGS